MKRPIKINYKIIFIHTISWIIFHALTLISVHARAQFKNMEYYPLDQFLNYLSGIFVFYFSAYVLLPTFASKNTYKIILYFLFTLFGFYFIQQCRTFSAILQNDYEELPEYFVKIPFMILAFSRDFFIYLAFATVYWFYLTKQKDEQAKFSILEKKHQTEMNFLKSQINIHFLYNTLNSFYSDALLYSDKLANNIFNLSKLMRYSLALDKSKITTIEEEIIYLNYYLDIQKMRFGETINIDFTYDSQLKDELCIHMGLLTLCENAFKYGNLQKRPLKININKINNCLEIYFENIISDSKQLFKSSKLGLENLQNRLNLIFPEKHQLDITNDLKTFKICLKIYQD